MTEEEEHPWAFAGRLFAQRDVEDACLYLQDDLGADVIVMLFFLWLGMAGRKLKAGEMQETLDLAEPWQRSAIRPLRRLRREVRNLEEDRSREIYTAIKASELALEKQELQVLWDAASASGLIFGPGTGDPEADPPKPGSPKSGPPKFGPPKSGHEAFAAANLEMYLASLELHQANLELHQNNRDLHQTNLELYQTNLELHEERLEGVGEGAGVAPLIDLLVAAAVRAFGFSPADSQL